MLDRTMNWRRDMKKIYKYSKNEQTKQKDSYSSKNESAKIERNAFRNYTI